VIDFGDAIRAGKFETVRDYLRNNPDCFHQEFRFDLLLRRLKTETEDLKKPLKVASPIKEDERNSNVKLTKLNNTSKENSFEKENSKLILSTRVPMNDDSEDVVDGNKVTRNKKIKNSINNCNDFCLSSNFQVKRRKVF
jgi:hypothetical protein